MRSCDDLKREYQEDKSELEAAEAEISKKTEIRATKQSYIRPKEEKIRWCVQRLYSLEQEIAGEDAKRRSLQRKIDAEEDIDKKWKLIDKKDAVTATIERKKDERYKVKDQKIDHEEELSAIKQRIQDLTFQIKLAEGTVTNRKSTMRSLKFSFEQKKCDGSIDY